LKRRRRSVKEVQPAADRRARKADEAITTKPPGQPGGFFFEREALLSFFFGVGALRGMSSNIDAIGTSRTRQISYSRAAVRKI
jgi:hypothetical protein